jgi:hypothetical protein
LGAFDVTVDVAVANVEGGLMVLGTTALEDTNGVTTVDFELEEELGDADEETTVDIKLELALEDADDDTTVELELEELDVLVVLLAVDDALVERMVEVGIELFP